MNLQNFIEVEHNFEPIIIYNGALHATELQRLFEERVKKERCFNLPKHIAFEGEKYIVYHELVGTFDRIAFAYCIQIVNNDIIVHVRRFEKANIVGKAAWSIAKNVFSGEQRTLKKEINLGKSISKLTKGMITASPLGAQSLVWADDYFRKINECLIEVVEQM